jgi:hypothetical protein
MIDITQYLPEEEHQVTAEEILAAQSIVTYKYTLLSSAGLMEAEIFEDDDFMRMFNKVVDLQEKFHEQKGE